MGRKGAVLALLGILACSCVVQADIVALKKSPGQPVSFALDSTIKAAIDGGTCVVYSGPDVGMDADLWTSTGWAPSNCYRNTGINPTVRSNAPSCRSSVCRCCRTSSVAGSPSAACGSTTTAATAVWTLRGTSPRATGRKATREPVRPTTAAFRV